MSSERRRSCREGRKAFIGLGFSERSDAFDFNVALQDHKKHIRMEEEAKEAAKRLQSMPKVDYSLKQGQTIKVNLPNAGKKRERKAKAAPAGGAFLPPPPKGGQARQQQGGLGGLAGIPGFGAPAAQPQQQTNFGGFGQPQPAGGFGAFQQPAQPQQQGGFDQFGAFSGASNNSQGGNVGSQNDWVSFQ